MGPFIVSKVEDKLITILDQNRIEGTFSTQQVKPYKQTTFSSGMLDSSEFLNEMLSPFLSGTLPKPPPNEVFMTEVIHPSDPRAEKLKEAKKKEIQGLIDRRTWKIVLKDEVPADANVLGGRFVLAIKDEGTRNEVWKARFVVQGYRDKLKTSLVHNNPNVRPHSVRLLIGLASVFGFRLFSTDVTQAYLQNADQLVRDVYLKPSKEFELALDKILKLLKPLYGLADSGEYWGKTLSEHLLKDIGMKSTLRDEAVFYKMMKNSLAGLCATYVDDILQAGNEEFSQLMKKTEEKFQCKSRDYDNVQFAGIEVESKDNGFDVPQKSYLSKLPTLEKHSTFKQFRSLRAKLSWAVNSRPDIACAVAQSTQVTEEMFGNEQDKLIKSLNTIVRHLKKTLGLTLKYPKLDMDSLSLYVYSDASYANNHDGTSQLGYIIFLTDKSQKCQPLVWSSHKAKRVTRLVLGSDTMAFADAFDMSYVVKRDMQRLIGRNISLTMVTDSLSLFDVITRASVSAEKG